MRIFLLLWLALSPLQAQVFSPQTINVEHLHYWDSQRWDYALIDLRQPFDYEQGHIPGAVNIPWPTLTRQMIHELRTEVVVLYSHNQKLTDLISHKFPYRVFALSGGLSSWNQASYPIVAEEESGFANSEASSVFMNGAANIERTFVETANSPYYEGAFTSGRPGPYAAKKPFRGRRNYRNKQPKPTRWTRGRLRRRANLLPTR